MWRAAGRYFFSEAVPRTTPSSTGRTVPRSTSGSSAARHAASLQADPPAGLPEGARKRLLDGAFPDGHGVAARLVEDLQHAAVADATGHVEARGRSRAGLLLTQAFGVGGDDLDGAAVFLA